ncbi:hypothetical protein [Halosimplex marinum]|uniref:hypothetical protein n=1 Tax=Halosimplex marinum TaxID=3396620 RepID=UPI003F57AAE3
MSRLTIVSILVTVVLIGIPTAANFYPPLFAGLADRLPINIIFTWMARTGILAIGAMSGWFVRGIWEKENESEGETVADEEIGTDINGETTVSEIDGCIEVEGSCWRGIAELSDEGISEINVEYKAICPNCQTVMYDGENSAPVAVATVGGGPDFWECPSCNHQTIDQYSKYEDAQNLFDSHVRRIVESEGEVYSLDNLIDEIPHEVTPRRIWEQYAETTDDSQVSINCFH